MTDILGIATKVLKKEAEAVLALVKRLNSNFERAIEIISGSTGRVIVTGMGKSGLVGKKIAATLSSTGTPAFFLHPAEAVRGDAEIVPSGDIAGLSREKPAQDLRRRLRATHLEIDLAEFPPGGDG